MNCNPFTLGHLYLIEEASKQVDYLYVFVVEEDKSYFPFIDRLALIQEGVSHLSNVIVLKSGKLIISTLTFPEYFTKEAKSTPNIDCSYDLTVFGDRIAPILNIRQRFVGSEPYCKVTEQYNIQMHYILKKYGIEVIELERKYLKLKTNEKTKCVSISASFVRELFQNSDFSTLRQLVPNVTYQYLLRKHKEN